MTKADQASDKFKAVKDTASKYLWINAVPSAHQYLAIVLSMVRFDYNVVLSLGLLLYIASNSSRPGEEFKNKEVRRAHADQLLVLGQLPGGPGLVLHRAEVLADIFAGGQARGRDLHEAVRVAAGGGGLRAGEHRTEGSSE